MGLFDFDGLKAEKQRTSSMLHISKLFRFVEMFLAMVLVSWTLARVPFAVRISGEFFRQLLGVVLSPLFVFLLCNVIIVTLLAKSGRLSGQIPSGHDGETELYEEIIKNSGDHKKSQSETDPLAHVPETIVYHDKQIITEMITTAREDDANMFSDSDSDSDLEHPKAYRRTQSEKFERENWEKSRGKLRRSETEKCPKGVKSEENPPENLAPEDELSNEEFQRTIEAFIAKQWKFRHQESLPIVLRNQSSVPVTN
ncbi:hypothetical protein FH972_004342 [Carpinus fangiana]|uniref:DUF4408 domain-containing protein n=1 Tax=Carpinus fangiana TaxID=176857 RepID=A0A5N6QKS7_9ROSI|nr:hypothetical protein FH972_004342 [Carpinus fangiana]